MEKQSVWFSKDKIFRKYRIVPLSKYNPREERERKSVRPMSFWESNWEWEMREPNNGLCTDPMQTVFL